MELLLNEDWGLTFFVCFKNIVEFLDWKVVYNLEWEYWSQIVFSWFKYRFVVDSIWIERGVESFGDKVELCAI